MIRQRIQPPDYMQRSTLAIFCALVRSEAVYVSNFNTRTHLCSVEVVDLSFLDKREGNCYLKLANNITSGRVGEFVYAYRLCPFFGERSGACLLVIDTAYKHRVLEIALQKLTNQNAILLESGLTEKY